MFHQFPQKHFGLFVEHMDKVVENLEMKRRSQKLSSCLPFLTSAAKYFNLFIEDLILRMVISI